VLRLPPRGDLLEPVPQFAPYLHHLDLAHVYGLEAVAPLYLPRL
jgi:hypothetical protein